MSKENTAILELVEELRAEGSEEGVQVCAYLDGERVIDVWTGKADLEGRVVDADTLFTIYSAAKGVSATCMHMLADRGKLDYERRIADFWPGFEAHGKGTATIRHAMQHQVGIPYLPPEAEPEQLCDWDYMTRAFAAMKPEWLPGEKTGYHSLNYNWFAGQIVLAHDGRNIGDFLQDEVCKPLGIDGLFLGITDDVEHRVAPVLPSRGEDGPLGLSMDRIEVSNLPCVRRSNWRGNANARSLARMYAMLANGGELDGVRLLSEERIKIATIVTFEGEDLITKRSVRRGLVYHVGSYGTPTSFGHSGGGGTLAFCDPATRFSFAYTKNLHAAPLSPERKATSGLASQPMIVARRCREVLGIA